MKIDVIRSRIPHLRNEYCDALNQELGDTNICDNPNPEDIWNNLKKAIHSTGLNTFGKRKRKDPDWYAASLETMEPVVEKKRLASMRMKSRPTRNALDELRACRAETQRTARECAKKYWESLCERIELARDRGDAQSMYSAIKEATGQCLNLVLF